MSRRTDALPDPLPEVARRWVVRRVFRATIDAFGEPMPRPRGRSADAILAIYTARSDALARRTIDDPARRAIVEDRLFAGTRRLARRIGRILGVRTERDALEVARRLYAAIGIDLRGDGREVVVRRCSFAGTYDAHVCRLMSSADAGLFAGLMDGARLTFTERITEGAPACVAQLSREGAR